MSVAIRSDDLHEVIRHCCDGGHLTLEQAEHVVGCIVDGQATHAQTSALLVSLARNGETADELTGAAQALRARAIAVRSTRDPLLDVCGTGGDRTGSFNISTCTALVVAGAGVAVAKHGNRAMSSRCGSADVLEELGVDVHVTAQTASGQLERAGLTFLYAPAFHPALQAVTPVRKDIGIRTLFNLIGPLCNPARPTHQIVGVPERGQLPILARALAALGSRRAAVVCSDDGMDELDVTGPNHVVEWNGSDLASYVIAPEMLGLPRHRNGAVKGGDACDNAAIIRDVLAGVRGPHRDVVVLNAALALYVAGVAADLHSAAALAQASIDSGRSAHALEALQATVS